MPMLEGKVDHVIGVDTHRDRHAAAILDLNGGLVAELTVTSDQTGAEALLGVVAQRAPGRQREALRVLQLTRYGAVKVAADAAASSRRCW